jgi:hypothetical protein
MRHSWKLLADFLSENGLTANALLRRGANVTVANFKSHAAGVYTRSTTRAAITHVNVLLATFTEGSRELNQRLDRAYGRQEPEKSRRYSMMWDLQQFLNYIRTAMPDNSQLTVVDLLKKSMALTMVFSACRIAELARMTVDTEKVTSERIQVETNTKSALAAMQSITILPVKDSRICPHVTLTEWLRRRRTQTALLYLRPSDDKPLTATLIARMLRELMTRAGIAECYGPYSIKHAVITYLYTKEAEEVQINEFGRWSLSSHVSGAYYRIATGEKDWLGYRIAEQ